MQKRLQHLPQWTVPFVWVAAALASAYGSPVQGQVISAPDGTGTTVDQQGDRIDITGGTQAGGNLFHSFEELSVGASETANFVSGSDVFNIVGRVSGLKPSYVEGRLQVSGSDANLYLINPAGVMFGPDAQLSLQGSFTATTADQVGFDDAWLDVYDSGATDYSRLSADPSAFRFTANAASAVVNQGDLAVNEGESLSLMGGNVINTGSLKASGGEVGLVAVGGQSTVSFAIPGSLLSLEVAEGDIPLGVGGGFSATALPALLTGSPGPLASSLVVNSDGSVFLGGVSTESREVGVSGEVSTRSAVADGGAIALLGNTVDLVDNAVLDASGVNGGTVLVGRGFGGQENLPVSTAVGSDPTVAIRSDGLAGAGGNVFFGASERAYARGSISAQGATQGGFVETSADFIELSGSVNASGQTGGGQWLIDPVDIEIVGGATGLNQIDPTVIESALDAGMDMSITTTVGTGGSGDIALSSSINQLGGRAANLTLTGRRFSRNNSSTINLTSTGQLTFELNQVNPETVASANSIESAIASIGTVNGNRLISLGAGTYDFSRPLSIGTQVEIVGAAADTTMLRDIGVGRLFTLTSAGNVSLRDLTFSTTALSGFGGGIRNNGGILTVKNSLFTNNRAFNGGAINSQGGTLSIFNSEFSGNQAAGSGGAIMIANGASVNIGDNTIFRNNHADDDAGALKIDASLVTVQDTAFENNTSTDAGGAVGVRGTSSLLFDTVVFDSNVGGSSGGAIEAWDGAGVSLLDSVLMGNSAAFSGGAIHSVSGSHVDIANSRIENNTAIGGEGGGLFISDGTATVSAGSILQGNYSQYGGGGVFANSSTLTIDDISFANNSAGLGLGGIADGGGLLAINGSFVDINSTLFSGNEAGGDGGGVSLSASSVGTIRGNSSFLGNRAGDDGGGVYVSDAGSILTVTDTRLEGNHSDDMGGGLYASFDAIANISSTLFDSNASDTQGGGAAFRTGSVANISNNTNFVNNTASSNGGGISVEGGAALTVSGNTALDHNTATLDGGGIFAHNAAALNILDAVLTFNTAGGSGGGVYAHNSNAVVIDNSDFYDNISRQNGGGLLLNAQSATISDNSYFVRNSAVTGGGIYSSGGDLTLADGFLSGNQASGSGGGLFQDSHTLNISNTRFQLNQAGLDGGGISLQGAVVAAMGSGTVFFDNSAVTNGGGLSTTSTGSVDISRSFWAENSAGDFGGALYKDTPGRVSITTSTFQDNLSNGDGGGLSLWGDGTTWMNSLTLSGNYALEDGGALHLADGGSAVLDSMTIENNRAGDRGGGLYHEGSGALSVSQAGLLRNRAENEGGAIMNNSVGGQLTINSVGFGDNVAGNRGGAIASRSRSLIEMVGAGFSRNQAETDDGGALYITNAAGLEINGATFTDNTAADQGGAIYYGSSGAANVESAHFVGNRALSDGGAIANNSTTGTLTLLNSGFDGNLTHKNGGALFARANSNTVVEGSTVSNNQAVGSGGGIYSAGDVAIRDAVVSGNRAEVNGGGLAIVGNGSLDLIDTIVENNTATRYGAGLLLSGNAIAQLTGTLTTNVEGVATSATTRFEGNTAGDDGGGINALADSSLQVSGVLFQRNVAGDDGGAIAAVERSRVVVENSNFENNRATTQGGGVYKNNAHRTTASGLTTATVINSRFIGNESAVAGGAFFLGETSGNAVVDDSLFRANQSATGGGLYNAGNITVTNTTLAGNRASEGGGIFNQGAAAVSNTTLSGNDATLYGGGIRTIGANAELTLLNATLSNNTAGSSGGGIAESNTQSAQLLNTIVAGNDSATAADVSGTFVDQGNNLIGEVEGSAGFTLSSLVGTAAAPLNPQLAPLADNGGPTQTHLLQANSPAINAAATTRLLSLDQRGNARLVGAAVDIGAVELSVSEIPAGILNAIAPNQPTPITPVLDPTLDPNPDPNLGSNPGLNPVFPNLPPALLSALQSAFSHLALGADGPTDLGLQISANTQESRDNATIRRLEQAFSQSFEDYWDLSAGTNLSFDDVQAILRRAQEEYTVNSAVIYAVFTPAEEIEESTSRILRAEAEPAGDDILQLALVMPEGELVRYQLPVTRAEAEQQVRLFRSTASDPDDALGYRPFSQQLYQWLLAPLEKELAAQGIQNLMYSLDRGLRTAPVSAMRDAAGFSLERYGISVVPSVGLMQADFPVRVRRSTVAMGVANFEHDAPLPAVPIELAVVENFVPISHTTLNEGTTLDALESVQALDQPGVLHLATHATFDPYSPDSSYIHLWNDSLSMKEFSDLDWAGSDLELLILSACSTAMSSPNAELGFAGLAAASGVDATVGSLWQVSDIGTLALMSEFYAQLESTDLRFEALRRAQLALLNGETQIKEGNLWTSRGAVALPEALNLPENATLEHPFFWSAFTMVGNPW